MTQLSTPEADALLGACRERIDALDERIIALLKERVEIVREVGKLKERTAPGRCPLRPGREAEQVRRVVRTFQNSIFHAEAAASIWRSIINGSLAVEGNITISALADEQHPELYWLAREYFGSFASIQRQPGVKRVIGDILDGKAAIGVVPVLRSDDVAPWWPDLAQAGFGGDGPKIFARIPFVEPKHPAKDMPAAIAIGNVMPEETGEDISFFALASEDNTSMHRLQSAFAAQRLKATWLDVMTEAGGRRHHLVEIDGFVTDKHPAFLEFAAGLGNSLLKSVFLGAYAVPVALAFPLKTAAHRHEARTAPA